MGMSIHRQRMGLLWLMGAWLVLAVACHAPEDLADLPPYNEDFQRAWFDAQNAWAKGDDNEAFQGFLRCGELEPEESSVPFMLGQIDAHRGNHPAAVDHYNRALTLDADAYWYRHRRGEALMAMGRREAARSDALFCIEQRPGDLDAAFYWIDAFSQAGYWEDALACCDRYEQLAGPDVEMALTRLDLLASSGNEEIYRKALRISLGKFPDEEALQWQWLDQLCKNPGPELDAFLAQMEARYPGDSQLHYYRFLRSVSRKEREKAFTFLPDLMAAQDIDAGFKLKLLSELPSLPGFDEKTQFSLFEALFAAHPGEPEVEALRAGYLEATGDLEGAREALLNRLLTSAHLLETWSHLIFLELQMGRWDDAQDHIEKALVRFPLDAQLHSHYAAIMIEKGQHDRAIELLRQAIELAWENPMLQAGWYGILGGLLHDAGDGAGSYAALESAIANDPGSAVWYNNQAYYLAERGEHLDRALECIQIALERQMSSELPGNYFDTRAWVHHRRGEEAEALNWIDQALAAEPRNALYLEHRGDILWALGRAEVAQQAWPAAREAGGDAARLALKPQSRP
jgi:tetratricopeptide (TPR) repeat protein